MRYQHEDDGTVAFRDLSPGDDFVFDDQLYQKIPTVRRAAQGTLDEFYNAVCLTRTTFGDQNLSRIITDTEVTKVCGEFKRDKK